MPFTPIGDTFKQNGRGPLKRQVEATFVIESANSIIQSLLGPEQALHAKPLFLKNRTLTITCSSSVVAQEIRLHQSEIVEKINQKLGKKEVDRIRYLA